MDGERLCWSGRQAVHNDVRNAWVTPLGPRTILRRTGRYGAPMLSHRKRLLILAVPVAASLALAGPVAAADSKGDKAILKAGGITKTDVPAEWASKRGQPRSRALPGLSGGQKGSCAEGTGHQDRP